jgi:predicted nucleotidyltransferase
MSIFKEPTIKDYSIVDPVQSSLDKDVVMGDKVNPKLRKEIYRALNVISKKMHIQFEKVWIIGSSLTFQWQPSSDIDVTIFIEKRNPEELTELNKQLATDYNEKLFYKEHPINFHFATGRYFKFKADAIYDLNSDKWIKKPEAISEKDLEEMIERCSSIKEFNEILEEYSEFKKLLESFDGSKKALDEILAKAFKVSALFQNIRNIRREDFKKRVDKNLPSANWRPSNIVFKLLEQYGLGNLVEEVSNFLLSRFKDQANGDGE